MTLFLVDVSGAYSNLSGVKTAGAAAVISRCMTEPGTIDPAYAPTQAAAAAVGLMGGAYCWLTGDFTGTTVEQRAERFIAAIGDPSELVIGLDTESPSYPTLHPAPTASDVARWMTVWRAHYPSHPVLDYLPRWYWARLSGSPDLSSVGPLWASAYPGWTSFADYTAHGGDSNPEWALAYAGYPRPALWQFAGSVSIGGINADLSAFRGTLAEFRALVLGGDMQLDSSISTGMVADFTPGATVYRDAARTIVFETNWAGGSTIGVVGVDAVNAAKFAAPNVCINLYEPVAPYARALVYVGADHMTNYRPRVTPPDPTPFAQADLDAAVSAAVTPLKADLATAAAKISAARSALS